MLISPIQLRSYQQRILDSAREAMANNRHTMVYAPGGSGKSVIIAYMALHSSRKENTVLVFTHRQEILNQNIAKMNLLNIPVKMVNATTKGIPKAQVVCAMAQTVASRCRSDQKWQDWLRTVDLIIVDEAHRQDADILFQFFKETAWVVGLSATVLRSGTMRQLGSLYSAVVANVTPQEIIGMHYLVPSRNFAFQAPKLVDVDMDRGTGDYVQRQLQQKFRSPDRYAGVIENYSRICPGSKALVFTVGSDHCVELCLEFNRAGIMAKYLISEDRPETDGEYSGERGTLLRDFANGVFNVLINIFVLDTGFDIPNLETVILDFSTKSYSRYIQAVSRGSRPFKGKTQFTVLDFGTNIETFGIYEDKPLCSLWHNTGGNGIAPTKICPPEKADPTGKLGCGRLIYISASDCPFCGWHWQTSKEVYAVELQEVLEREKEDMSTIPAYVASMMLKGRNANQILVAVCIRNKDNPKRAFFEAIKYIRTKEGNMVKPEYWWFFKTNILKDKLVR